MTPKAEHLLNVVVPESSIGRFYVAYNELVSYIEELERKAQAYDAMCPHCGSTQVTCTCVD